MAKEHDTPWSPHIEAEQNNRHFADNVFQCIFLHENTGIFIKISLEFVPKGSINNIPALVQIMAWRWQHQAITWTNVDWSSVKSCDIHIKTISEQMPNHQTLKTVSKLRV